MNLEKTGKVRQVKKYWIFGPLIAKEEWVHWCYEDSTFPCTAIYPEYYWKRVAQ